MPVPSLFELARQRLLKSIDMLTDIGDLPYAFLESILRHIQNPAQLQELETNCPQLLGETEEIWLKFIKRDIPDWEKKPHRPRDPKNWSKVYRKLLRDAEKEKQDQEDKLKERMLALRNDRAQNTTLIVNDRIPYMRSGAGRMSTSSRGSGSGSWGIPGAPSKTGKVALDKLKRGIFDHNRERPKAAQMPAHVLAQRRAQVQQAPPRLIRMAQNELPVRPFAVPKQNPVPTAKRAEPFAGTNRPNITHKPVSQSCPTPVRTSLPAGQQFHAPRLPQGSASSTTPKRPRDAGANLFHQPKRRRV